MTACHRYVQEGSVVRVPLSLPPASSLFVVFAEQFRPAHLVALQRDGKEVIADAEVLAVTPDSVSMKVVKGGGYLLQFDGREKQAVAVPALPDDQTIAGSWQVRFLLAGERVETVGMETLQGWTTLNAPELRCFSGTASYQTRFTVLRTGDDLSVILDLGEVREVARVKLNGKEVGILGKAPYRAEVTDLLREGENLLEIELTNVWNNRLVGDAQPRVAERGTRTNLASKFHPKSPLLPPGLLGPVVLRHVKTVTVPMK